MARCGFVLFRTLMFVVALACSSSAFAYSLLTHEQLIDLTWDDSIVPLLLDRYHGLTPEQLQQARAYAYGGCVIQDIGYYPYGDPKFSDLTHYVRSGDFVVNLFRNAHNANELAFAIGALSHYIGDNIGHSVATNLAVPVEFPKLQARYGNSVNYAEGKHQHVQTEFAFDINEVAHHRMAPLRYLQKIGLGVPMDQLSKAYYQTYGMSENFSGTRGRRINVRAYNFAVRGFIPRIAYAETLMHGRAEPRDPDTPEAIALRQEIDAMAVENNWHAYRHHAGPGTWALAVLLFIVPKIGPLKVAAIKGPTTVTEAQYLHSVNLSINEMRRVLASFTPPKSRHSRAVPVSYSAAPPASSSSSEPAPRESRDPQHPLPNRDLDTGKVVQPGGYPLTDSTYADLLHLLTRQPNIPVPPALKQDVQDYYRDPSAPISTKKNPEKWAQVQADLEILKGMPTSPVPEPFQTYEDNAQ